MGRETARLLEPAALGVITQAPQLYSIGLHGPDLFFYYKPLSKNPVNQLGHGLHDRPGREFFERAARVLKAHPDSVAHRAYVYTSSATLCWTPSAMIMWQRRWRPPD